MTEEKKHYEEIKRQILAAKQDGLRGYLYVGREISEKTMKLLQRAGFFLEVKIFGTDKIYQLDF